MSQTCTILFLILFNIIAQRFFLFTNDIVQTYHLFYINFFSILIIFLFVLD